MTPGVTNLGQKTNEKRNACNCYVLETQLFPCVAAVMRTPHIAPGASAGGSLREALRKAGRDEEVLANRDDLSCGPIDSDDHSVRTDWWSQFYDRAELENDFKGFWDRIATTGDRLVVWVGRHSASELAFFLALSDRLGDRPYDIIDVTARQWLTRRADGATGPSRPAQCVGLIPDERLVTLLGTEQPPTEEGRGQARQRWRQLRKENAPFRVVSPAGLVSAPMDHFDPLLLERTTAEWTKIARVVGDTMGYSMDPYYQVGDVMLLARVVALVDAGKLIADGDPWDMHACRIRLPDPLTPSSAP
jgi:hypothetical protein